MILSKRSKNQSAPVHLDLDSALACRPVKNIRVSQETRADGNVRLTYPVILRPWFSRLASLMGKWDGRPTMKKLDLDEMGTAAWSLIDGKRTVGDIVSGFTEKYSLHPREAQYSVTAFMRELGKRGIIGMQ